MIDALANFHFIRPAWLLLVPLAIGLWWFWQRQREPLRGWREQMDPELLAALVVGDGAKRDRAAHWLLAGWILAAIAIAGPTWRLEPNPFADDALPLMILLKASETMELADPAPTRMERAQLKIADLAERRNGQPLGLIAYAGSAHLVLPPTRYTELISQMAAEISPAIMPMPGDRLDLAIRRAQKILDQNAAGGSLLVMADSVEQDPRQVADAMSDGPKLPIQFLALTGDESRESETIREAARSLGAEVNPLTVDEQDINAIETFAERRAASGIAGESSRWQEAGYWLTPVLALLVALSFRKQTKVSEESAE